MGAWTAERIETLTDLWTRGETASVIARMLGGVTRDAVIGKAHRLKLSARPSPLGTEGSSFYRKGGLSLHTLPEAGEPIMVVVSEPSEGGIVCEGIEAKPRAMRERPTPPRSSVYGKTGWIGVALAVSKIKPSSCRWPEGDPRDAAFRFCCAPRVPKSAYCSAHSARAFRN